MKLSTDMTPSQLDHAARQFIDDMRQYRTDMAERLRYWRERLASIGLRNDAPLVRHRAGHSPALRVTVRDFRKCAADSARFARQPIGRNPLSNEYYTACGWDDARCEWLDECEREFFVARRAAELLKAEG